MENEKLHLLTDVFVWCYLFWNHFSTDCEIISGSPAISGDRKEDGDADDSAVDFNYSSENQNQKQKIAERMLSWQMMYGRGEDLGAPNYDKEVSHNRIPLLTNGHEVSQSDSGVLLSFLKKQEYLEIEMIFFIWTWSLSFACI